MTIQEAQEEVRAVYLGGSVGQLVSGAIWLASAALATAGARQQAILTLLGGGVFIFPLTTLVLRVADRAGRLATGVAASLINIAVLTSLRSTPGAVDPCAGR